MCGVGQRLHTNKAKEANGWIPALHHCHIELTLGWSLHYDEPNNMTLIWEYAPCLISRASTTKQANINPSKGKKTLKWCSIQIMPPDMAQYGFDSTYYGTCESPGDSNSQPGCQDLCPINAQTTRIWAKLRNAATWLTQTKAH